MTKRIALLTTLLLSLVLMPGCPETGSVLVGDWIITVGSLDHGLQINADGTATSYMLDDIFPGTFTWKVDGTRVIFHHVSSVNKLVWVAELTSETTMNGAAVFWAGSVGSNYNWSAVKQ